MSLSRKTFFLFLVNQFSKRENLKNFDEKDFKFERLLNEVNNTYK